MICLPSRSTSRHRWRCGASATRSCWSSSTLIPAASCETCPPPRACAAGLTLIVLAVWEGISVQTRAMHVGPLEADRDASPSSRCRAGWLSRSPKRWRTRQRWSVTRVADRRRNPLWPRYERAVKACLTVSTEFGLTPSSRDATRLTTFVAVSDFDDLAGGPTG
jgi:hypothetical protein